MPKTKQTELMLPFFTKKPYHIQEKQPETYMPIFFLTYDGEIRLGFRDKNNKYRSGPYIMSPVYWWPSQGINVSLVFRDYVFEK